MKNLLQKLNIQLPYFSSGHVHSPVPSAKEETQFYSYQDIELNIEDQFELIQKFQNYYKDIPWSDSSQENLLYHFKNEFFLHSDAVILWSMIHHFRPQRIIEIGSGYSTACMMDSIRFAKLSTHVTTIDIETSRLEKLIQKESVKDFQIDIINLELTKVDVKIFESLESGDILFVDSSHVSKWGSDLHKIFFQIFPLLNPGVIVHFHDVFKNFEYPRAWIDEGIYWNEQYLLRAFLQNNSDYKILYFSDLMEHEHEDWFRQNMPLCLTTHQKYKLGTKRGTPIKDIRGQSLYIQKLV